MAGVDRVKRGVLITAGLLLISLALLSMAISFREGQGRSDDEMIELLRHERVASLTDNILHGVRELHNTSSGIRIETTNQTVRFIDETAFVSGFESQMDDFGAFLAERVGSVRFNHNETPRILLLPERVEYLSTESQIALVSDAVPGKRYDVNITVAGNATSCVPTTDSGDFELEIFIDSEQSDCARSLRIDPEGSSRLHVATNEGPIIIEMNDTDLYITMEREVHVRVQLWYNRTDGNYREARLQPDDLVSIDIPGFGFSRATDLLLATW